MSFKEKFIRFMSGRYGYDELGIGLIVFYFLLMIAGIFVTDNKVKLVLYALMSAALILSFFRMMSRNIVRRRSENAVFLRFLAPFKSWWALQKNRFRDRKTHIYRKCPACKAVLRLPKAKGKKSVVCPKCSKRFNIYTPGL
ncbi:MAG: hypothetical protein GX628_03060 [Clostridiales bacterium]|nr:hypothetical protein [Clostridiales bacterium]